MPRYDYVTEASEVMQISIDIGDLSHMMDIPADSMFTVSVIWSYNDENTYYVPKSFGYAL